MENLLMYLMENLLKYGEVEKSDSIKLSGEDTFFIKIKNACFTLKRSEIIILKTECEKRLEYMSDNELKIWNKLLNLL